MQTDTFNSSVVEALILASPEPLPARKIADQVEDLSSNQIGRLVAELNTRYFQSGSSYRIREIAGGFQFYILPEYTPYVEEMFTRRRKMRLTRPALETLAIIAYRQPVTKTDIEHIRGVAADGVLHNLLEKDMITIKGRASTVGKPLQYGTTDEFLKFFGLAGLDDLPKMKEIEELIKAAEGESGDQLSFETGALDAQLAQKLNVADGTFDPRSRDEDFESELVREPVTALDLETEQSELEQLAERPNGDPGEDLDDDEDDEEDDPLDLDGVDDLDADSTDEDWPDDAEADDGDSDSEFPDDDDAVADDDNSDRR